MSQQATGQQFKCPQCGGEMTFDAAAQGLRCGYCKHLVPTPAPTPAMQPQAQMPMQMQQPGAAMVPAGGAMPARPREIPLRDGLSLAPRGLGVQLQAVQCKECGATVNLGANDRTAACTYCASTMVMPVATDANLITPESLVPFIVPRERAGVQFKEWLKGLWFRPSDLARMAKLDQIVGVYAPFWTFDAIAYSQWNAERGWYYYETETYETVQDGKSVTSTRQVQRTRWEPAWGTRQDTYDDVLVCASRGIPEKLVDKFSTFDTRALVLFSPAYLAGWRAESYAVDLMAGWTLGQKKIETSQYQRCSKDVGGDTQRGLQVANRFSNETFKHVLLPVYVAAYRYKNKPFRFLVNGQSGEVVGEAPLSAWKITGLVLLIVGLLAAAWLIWAYSRGDLGSNDPRRTIGTPSVVAQSASRPRDGVRRVEAISHGSPRFSGAIVPSSASRRG